MKWGRRSVERGAVQRSGRSAGFTLVEMTLAAGLMALVLAVGYACFQAGIATQRMVEPRLEALQTARVALALLTADLRCACPLAKDMEFVGTNRKIADLDAGNLDFGTFHHTPSRPGEGDFCQTSYYVEIDPQTRERVLWRRRNPRLAPDPLTGGSREEIARGVRELKFEFYDGYEWYDSWGDAQGNSKKQFSLNTQWNLTGMPEAVRITFSLELEKPRRSEAETGEAAPEKKGEAPLVFQTVARINVPRTSSSGSSSGSDGGSGGTPGGTPNAMSFPGGG